MKKSQTGFTMIELIMVIAILGILAAFAMPRFANLGVEARISAINGLGGSVQAAAAIAHSISLAQNKADGDPVDMEGQSVTMAFKYPTSNALGIVEALASTQGFTSVASGTDWIFTRADGATPANCSVLYAQPALAGEAPTVTIDTSAC